jgi:hypothetical protein
MMSGSDDTRLARSHGSRRRAARPMACRRSRIKT